MATLQQLSKALALQFASALILVFLTQTLLPHAQAATYYWDSNGSTAGFGTAQGTWADPTTNDATQGWSTSSTGVNAMSGNTTTNTADTLWFGTDSNQLGTGTVTVSGNVSANYINFRSTSSNISLSGGNITVQGFLSASNSGNTTAITDTISSNITLNATQNWTVNNGGSVGTANLDVSGNVLGGSYSLSKQGNGTLTLSGAANTWNGTTTVSAGTLTLSGSLTTNGDIRVNGSTTANPVLNITGNLTQTKPSNPRNVVIAGTLNNVGTVNVSGSANVTFTGLYISEDSGGNGVFNQSGGTVNVGGQVYLSGQTSQMNVSGGTFNMGTQSLYIGAGGPTYVSNSTLTVNGTGSINMGTLTFGISSRNATAMTVNLGDGTTGGNLSINGMSYAAGASAGPTTINFNGGTLTANNSFSMIAQASTVVKSGGAIINVVPSRTFTIGTALTDGGGGGGLTKEGTGTLTLSGNNTYTGTTTVNAGTLTLGASQNLGAIAGAGALNLSSYTLTTNATSNTTYSGVISGSGPLTKNGIGTLTISGANTYTGTTTIADGVFQIGDGGTTGSLSTSSAIVISGAGAFLDFNRSNTITQGTDFNSVISGNGSVRQQGSGNLILSGANTYTGTTMVNSGTLSTSGANVISDSSDVIVASGATLSLGGTETVATIAGAGLISIGANTLTVGSANSADFSGDITGTTAGFTKSGSGTQTLSGAANTWNGTTTVSAGTLTLSGSLTTNGSIVVNGNSSANPILNITGNLTQTKPSNPRNFVIAGTLNNVGTVNVSGSANVTLTGLYISEDFGGNGVFNQSGGTVNVGGDVYLSGQTSQMNVSGGTFNMGTRSLYIGTGGPTYVSNSTLTVNGTGSINMGTLTFGISSRNATAMTVNLGDGTTGGNLSINGMSYAAGAGSGATTINFNGGTLTANNSFSMITQASTVVKSGGAIINVAATRAFTIGTALTDGGGGGGLTKEGTGTLTLSGANTYTGTTTVNAGTLTLGTNQNLGAIAGAGALNLSSYTLTTNASSDSTFSGVISGTGALTKNGTGTLTLNGSNTFTGAITINSGSLVLEAPSAAYGFSSSGIIINNGSEITIQGGYYFSDGKSFTFDSNGGGEIIIGSGNNIFRGNQTFTTNGGSQNIISGSYLNCDNGGTRTFNIADGTDDIDLLVSALLQNTMNFEKAGAGKISLTANNTYSGNTTISAGILEIGAAGRLGGGAYAANISNNATFLYSGTNNQTLSGVISGTGALMQNGTGTLTLSGANTYTGTTTINAGTLATSAANKIADTSEIVVNSGGTLTLGGAETVGAISGAGSISIGANALTISSSSDSIFSGAITGSTGGITKSGTGTLDLSGAGNSWNGTTTVSAGTITLSGSLATSGAIAINGVSGAVLNITGNLTQTGGAVRRFQLATTSGRTGTVNVSGSGILSIGGMFLGENGGGNGTMNVSGGTVTSSGQVWWAGANSTMNISGGTFDAGSQTAYIGGGSGTTQSTLTVNGTGLFSAGIMDFATGGANATTTINIGDGAVGGNISITSFNIRTTNVSNTLNFNGGTLTVRNSTSINAASNLSTIVKSGGAIFNITGANTLAISSNLTTDGTGGGLTKDGTGTLTLSGAGNTYTGTTTVNAGTLTLGANQNLGAIAGAGALNLSSYTLTTNASSDSTYSGVISGTGALTKSGSGNLTLSGANSYSGATTINAGTLTLSGASTGGGAYTIDSTLNIQGNLTFAGNNAMYVGNGLSGTVNHSEGTVTFAAGNTLQMLIGNGAAANGSTYNLSGNGVLSIGASSNRGIMIGRNGGSVGNLANTAFNMSGGTITNSSDLMIGRYDFAAVYMNATYSQTGGNATHANLKLGGNAGNGANSNVFLTLTGGNFTATNFTSLAAGNSVNATITIGGNAVVDLPAFATTRGTGSNAYLVFDGGTLRPTASSSAYIGGLTSATIRSGGATFDTNGNDITISQALLANATSTGGGLTKNGSGTLTLTGNNTYTGDTTINAGTIEIGAAGLLGSGNYAGNIANSGTLIYSGTNNQTLSGVISSTGALTKNGTSTLTLSASNNYSGGTTLNTGTLVIGNTTAAGSGTITQTSGSSLLKIDTTGTITNDMSVYNVLASQSATLSGAITVNNATWDIDTGDTLTISGAVSGNGGVTKNGGGTLVLSGNNTYLAPTVINAGTLNATSVNALGSNNTVTVNGGSLLVSTDDAINAMTVTLNSTSTNVAGLAFSGNYSGLVDNLTLSKNSIIDLGNGSVSIMFDTFVMNSFTLDIYNWTGTTLWNGGTGNDTDKVYFGPDLSDAALAKIYFHSGAVGGGDSFLGSGYDLGLQQTSWDSGLDGYHIIPVPEPETYATGLLLLLGGAWWMFKRNRKAEGGCRRV